MSRPAGLAVNGKLFLVDPNARRAHVHMQGGSVRGISIGYLPPKGGKVEMRSDGTRLLKEVRLMEVSVCPLPMAPRAQITSAKSLADVELVLKSLRSEEMEDNLERLLEIDRELRRLLAGRDPEVEKAATLQQLQAFALELRKVGSLKPKSSYAGSSGRLLFLVSRLGVGRRSNSRTATSGLDRKGNLLFWQP